MSPLDAMATAVVALDFAALALLALLGTHRAWLALVVLRQRRAGAHRGVEGLPCVDESGAESGAEAGDEAVERPGPERPSADATPHVTVQCPIYDEPDVAARLIDAACALDHPRDRLEIQVLDDSDDETSAIIDERVAHHRARGVDVRAVRRAGRTGFKAGALDHGLGRARGELVAIFDADFVPSPDFLRQTLPAFADPDVGLVQARWGHLNRTRSGLTRVQALLLDGHFLVEHAGRAAAGAFFNFNGTAGIFRRRCIEEAGGWQHDTLTEDLDLSYRAQLAGWRFVFLENVVAPAELPTSFAAWKSQQRRWTRGALQTARKLMPAIAAAPLPLRVKREAAAHLLANAAYPLLLTLALATFPSALARNAWGWGALAAIEVPLLLATTGIVALFYLFAARRAGDGFLGPLVLLPSLIALGVGASLNSTRAVVAGLRRRVGEFVRTPKTGDVEGAAPALRTTTRGRVDGWALAEVSVGVLLAVEVALAAWWGLWATIPFLALFAAGFLWVGLGTLRPRAA